jgi:hypothetical protein
MKTEENASGDQQQRRARGGEDQTFGYLGAEDD